MRSPPMPNLPVTRVVLYKHGVGYFEREGAVEGDAALTLTFKQAEVSDVLKSLTVLDLDGGHVASVSYDSTKPLEQLLAEVALSIPDQGSLVGLLPQIKGARVAVTLTESHNLADSRVEGVVLGVDTVERQSDYTTVKTVMISLLTDGGELRSFDLHGMHRLELLDAGLRRDLDYYLRTQLSAKKKDARTFTFFAEGQGQRRIGLSYTVEAPVWKATYRILLGEKDSPPMIQGWAVVDNTTDEDWDAVTLSLVAGLPVSFRHDLYTPRYIRRPVVEVQETTGVLPPEMEEAVALAEPTAGGGGELSVRQRRKMEKAMGGAVLEEGRVAKSAISSTPAQVRERKLGDLFEYEIEHPVTIRRNQSALVPIVLRAFEGRAVLLYNKSNRAENPMRCVEFKNTTRLTLEGGPVTVLEKGSYVGEAMLDTLKPDEERLVPYAVELAVRVTDRIDTREEPVHRVIIRSGYLCTDYVQARQTTYTLKNKGDTAYILYLEHPRQQGEWELFDTLAPQVVTDNFWRFRLNLPARAETPFVVKQKHTLQRAY